ncbi:MAG: citramalate synthase [Candidatus Caenarcaniphilales bacterium]|nr:citramalate synthase [Candidatus Caenarcaniphilales bacterium]
MRAVEIYDTTLRDGAQMRGISFSVNDKLRILEILDDLGLSYVEGGWPGANPKDVDFFIEAAKLKLRNTKLTAFGSTRKANTKVVEDPILAALLRANTEVVCIVGKSSAWQITNTMKASLEETLDMLEESINYLKAEGRKVFVDAEHFYDGFIDNPDFSHKFVTTAIKAGADRMVLCDTNGGSLPEYVFNISKEFVDKYNSQIGFGIHAHNDGELAVANSIRAVRAGVMQVQGTINGYGERCGNANIISVIANLQLKVRDQEIICIAPSNLAKLTNVAKKVAEIANMNLNQSQPFVGARAFTHKGGLHASAIAKDKSSYEHIDPSIVGNKTRVVVSDQSGLSNIIDWLNNNNFVFDNEDKQKQAASKILTAIKDQEHQGYSYENAGASLELLVRKILNQCPKYFELVENNVHIVNGEQTEATVRIKIGEVEKHSVSLGNGPANALDSALRKALRDHYPEIENFSLQDFKVRILDSHLGSGAITKVQVTTGTKDKKSWDTIGVSSNIIKASWDAIVDSIVFGLISESVPCTSLETRII